MADPHKYVFKPQREGGGECCYGPDGGGQLTSVIVISLCTVLVV